MPPPLQTEESRGPNPSTPFPWTQLGDSIRILSWNCRGLVVSDPSDRRKFLAFLRDLVKGANIVCLQEVHGLSYETQSEISILLPGWTVLYSAVRGPDGVQIPGAGGVAVLLEPKFQSFATWDNFELTPGRVQFVPINFGNKTLNIFNIHNYGLAESDVRCVGERILLCSRFDSSHPDLSASFVLGDLNYLSGRESPLKLGKHATETSVASSYGSSGSRAAIWEHYLGGLVELHQPLPTRFNIEALSVSRLDRAYTSLPGSLLVKLGVDAFLTHAPETLHYKGISDHSPLGLSFSPKHLVRTISKALPRHWCYGSVFNESLMQYIEYTNLLQLPPFERVRTYKTCIQCAALCSRDAQRFSDMRGSDSVRLILESVSRALWKNDHKLARTLLNSTSLASSFIKIELGRVVAVCPEELESAYTFEKQSHLKREIRTLHTLSAQAVAPNERKQLKSKIQAARRLQSVWWPRDRKLRLFGLRVQGPGGSQVLSAPQVVQQTLASHWGPVYEWKSVDVDALNKFLGVYARRNQDKFDFESLELPDVEDLESAILRSGSSTCGRDGVPNIAWRAHPNVSARVIHGVLGELSKSDESLSLEEFETLEGFLKEFNIQNFVFAPKKTEREDNICPTRQPGDLRTISLLNSDNKFIAKAINRKVIAPTLAITPSNQRGFCPGRQFPLNVVVLDTFMRVFNHLSGDCEFSAADCPVLALYDLCNAFPSIAHLWLFAVLQCLRLPTKYYNVIRNMYRASHAYSVGVGTCDFLFKVLAGVRTGCPLSATLFLLSFNPFVDLINFISDGPKVSVSCICADDVGSVLRALSDIRYQYSVFKLAEKTAAMFLKPSKCFLVVSVCDLSETVRAAIQEWLRENIPEWKDFQIVPAGKYLGVVLGRRGEELTFEGPFEKFQDRIIDLADSTAPTLPTVLRYNERVVSVFSYISQLVPPPRSFNLSSLEQRCIHKILKLPPNCMSRKLLHSCEQFLAVAPKGLIASCHAARFRFAHSESQFLNELHCQAIAWLGNNADVVSSTFGTLPKGGIEGVSLLDSLLGTLRLKGELSCFRSDVEGQGSAEARMFRISSTGEVAHRPHAIKGKKVSVQTDSYNLFLTRDRIDPCRGLLSKIEVTFGDELFPRLIFSPQWFQELLKGLDVVKVQVRVALFKTLIGGWTTTHRMHEDRILGCIFGCQGEVDTICHYVQCAPLWLIVCSTLGHSAPLSISERICIDKCTPCRLQSLAIAFHVYHHTKNSLTRTVGGLIQPSPNWSQQVCFESARTFKSHLVGSSGQERCLPKGPSVDTTIVSGSSIAHADPWYINFIPGVGFVSTSPHKGVLPNAHADPRYINFIPGVGFVSTSPHKGVLPKIPISSSPLSLRGYERV